MDTILKDRFMRGIITGFLAGVVTFAWNLFSHYVLHFATLIWSDFSAALIFRRRIESTWEFIFAVIVTFAFVSLLGMFFSNIDTSCRIQVLVV